MRPPPRLEVPINPEKYQGVVPAHLLPKASRRQTPDLREELARSGERFFRRAPEPQESSPPTAPLPPPLPPTPDREPLPVPPAPLPEELPLPTPIKAPPAKRQISPEVRFRMAERAQIAAVKRWADFERKIREREPEVVALREGGYSVTEVMLRTGLSRFMVKKLSGARVYACPCGLPADHRGDCPPLPAGELDTPERIAARERARERTASAEYREACRLRAWRMQEARPPEDRRRAAREGHANRTEAQRSATALRAASKRLKNQAARRGRAEQRVEAARGGFRLAARLGSGVLAAELSGVDVAELAPAERKLLADIAVLFDRHGKGKL